MTKVAIFSDLHAHPFKPYAGILENGMNSRLADAVHCIDQVVDYCVSEGVDLALFGGDLFHVRRTINVAAFNAVYESMSKFALNGIPLVMIHGNHDQADKKGNTHSIHAFRTFCSVTDNPGWLVVHGKSGEPYAIMAIPYMENVEQLRDIVQEPCPIAQVPKILLGHLGIRGAKVGADFVYVNPYDADAADLNAGAFDAAYLGHHHLHQQIAANGWYIGAALQHNWGDRDQWRGFLVYDTETKSHTRHTLQAPQFVECREGWFHKRFHNDDFAPFKDNYVRVIDDTNANYTDDQREEMRTATGARSLEVVPPKVAKTRAQGPRIEVDTGMSFSDLMRRYVKSGVHATGGLEEDYLLQIGRDILEEVGE
jgi:DNA repair exonuclease SbcCD nuclease subunit